jgi:hypothetical protein
LTDLEAKQIVKKYKSKAAQSYQVELVKMMDTEALKRGEAVSEATMAAAAANGGDDTNNTNLLANLSLAEQNSQDAVARQKLTAARAANSALAQSKAVLVSQLPNTRGKLAKPPSSGNGPKVMMLRKPGSSATSMNMLKKKSRVR